METEILIWESLVKILTTNGNWDYLEIMRGVLVKSLILNPLLRETLIGRMSMEMVPWMYS